MNLRSSQGRVEEKPTTRVEEMLLNQGLLEEEEDG
jgi:hypothetical protein